MEICWPSCTLFTARSVNLDLSFAWPSTTVYLNPLDLAGPRRVRIGSGWHTTRSGGETLVKTTKVRVSGRLALACGGCGEIILFLGRERDWYETGEDGRPRLNRHLDQIHNREAARNRKALKYTAFRS